MSGNPGTTPPSPAVNAEARAVSTEQLEPLTLENLSKKHKSRSISETRNGSHRVSLPRDFILDAGIEPGGDCQPLVYGGGSPLVVTDPCIIIRGHPGSEDNDEQQE